MENIQLKNCQGYLWYSDQSKPKVYIDEDVDLNLDEKSNPFIVEGQLYSPDTQESVSIKYEDGKYRVYRYEPSMRSQGLEEGKIEQYVPNVRLGLKDKVLYFARLWKETEVEDSCGFATLRPSALVFKGIGQPIKEK